MNKQNVSQMIGIGERIKSKRKSKRYSQLELSNKSGVALKTIRTYEAGSVNPRLGNLEKLAEALGCDVEELVLGNKDFPKQQSEEELKITRNLDNWASGETFDWIYKNFADLYINSLKDIFEVIECDGEWEMYEWQRIEVLEKLYQIYRDCGGLNE